MGEPSLIMTHPFQRTGSLLLLALACAAPAQAWNAEGHAAVGLVAGQNLTPEARKQVIKILGSDDLASIASWMDQLRSAYFHTGPLGDDPEALKFNAEFPKNNTWHYVDLPLGLDYRDFSIKVEGMTEPNAYIALLGMEHDLNDPNASRDQKIVALKFLVHIVEDMHQPMHVSRAEDKGGNSRSQDGAY